MTMHFCWQFILYSYTYLADVEIESVGHTRADAADESASVEHRHVPR